MVATRREVLHACRAAGLALGLLGTAALVGFELAPSHGLAIGTTLLGAVGYAVGPIAVSERLSNVPPLGVIALSLTMATELYAPFVAGAWPMVVGWRAGSAVLVLGLVCTALAFVLFFALIAEVDLRVPQWSPTSTQWWRRCCGRCSLARQ